MLWSPQMTIEKIKKELQELSKEWENLAHKFSKQAREHDYNSELWGKCFVMSETYNYCSDCLKKLLKRSSKKSTQV